MGVEWGPGDRFARYTVESCLGAGGMGVVYRVHDPALQRRAALKVITADMAGTAEFRDRFVREVRLLAEVDHPNVLPLYEWGEYGGHLYSVTRFVDGGDLRGLLDRSRRLTADHALRVVDQVARALDAAHAAKVVHRDVKPANVLLDGAYGQEHVYLADFGLACPVDGSSALTRTGEGLGTLLYVAPEQFASGRVGPAADVYALALVVYEMLVGHPLGLFERDQLSLPDVSGAGRLVAVLGRALSRRPEARHESAGALVADVRAAFDDAAPPVSARRHSGATVSRRAGVPAHEHGRAALLSEPGWDSATSLSTSLVPFDAQPVRSLAAHGRAPLMAVAAVFLMGAVSLLIGHSGRMDPTPPTPSPTTAAPAVEAPPTTVPSASSPPPSQRRAAASRSPSTTAARQPVVREVCAESLTVRREPQSIDETDVLASLRRGDTFQVLDTRGRTWAFGVSSGSTRVRGWVLAGYLESQC